MALISIIVPVYDVEKYLPRCIDSIIEQTYTDFDVILVDDGSPDQSGVLCDAYAQQDPRIHVIHQINGGLSAARNTGINWAFQHSSSQWLTFIDSDDWIHPLYLEVLLEAAGIHHVAISIGDAFWTEKEPLPKEISKDSKLWRTRNYYLKHTVNATVAWGKLYKKKCFENICFPKGRIHEDEYVTYRILFQHEFIAVASAPLYAYYQNPNGIMKRAWTSNRLDAIDALEEQINFFLEQGEENIARKRFFDLVHHLLDNQTRILESSALDRKEKRRYAAVVRKSLRKNVYHFRKFKWLPVRSYKYIYANMFNATRILMKFKNKYEFKRAS